MAEPDATQIVAGPGLLYVAPLGTTLPITDAHGEYPITWPTGWVAVGYTDAGIDSTYTPTIKEIMVDEETSPVDDVLSAEKFIVQAKLAEVTLQNYNYAISASTFTSTPAESDTKVSVGSNPLTYVMVGIEGPAPGTNKQRLILVQKAIAKGAVAIKMQRKDKVVFAVEFDARKISGQPLYTIDDFGSSAS